MKNRNLARRTFLAAGLGAAASLALKPVFGQSQDLAQLSTLSMKKVADLVRSRAVAGVALLGEDGANVFLEEVEVVARRFRGAGWTE